MDNYGDYILGIINKKNFIKKWKDCTYKEKPLIIYGNAGIGKTKLVEHITSGFIPIKIDIDFCKKKNNLNEFVEMSLYKKSITMMFDKNIREKVLIFDDLKHIQSNDKTLFKQIVDFSKKKIPYRIIYIFQTINHKSVQTIYKKCFPINITFNLKQMEMIVKTYYPIQKIDVKELIKKSSFNFHNIKINIELFGDNIDTVIQYDRKYDDTFEILEKVINDSSFVNIYRDAICDYSILNLNILENIPHWLFNHKKLSYDKKINILLSIFNSSCIGDFLYTKLKMYNEWDIINHIITYSVLTPVMLLSKHGIKTKEKKYNKYLSRSIIYTYNNKLLFYYGMNSVRFSILYNLAHNYNHKNVSFDVLEAFIKRYSINQKIFEKFSKYYDFEFSKILVNNIFKK